MSLFSTLNTGVTGLGVNATSLAVTGDNLANLNTIGFKGGRAQFQDLLITDIRGSNRTSQLGMGAFLGGVSTAFTQGSISATGRSSDLAVDGAGFFVVHDDDAGTFYTRAGALEIDTEGRLTTLGGYALQGYQADINGNIGSSLADLMITPDTLSPNATTEVDITANLDSDEDVVAVPWVTLPTDHDTAADGASYSTSMTIYDSLGAPHDVIVYFQKTNTNQWTYWAAADAGETGGTPGDTELIETGILDFDTDGTLLTHLVVTNNPITFSGAAAQTVAFDLGDPLAVDPDGMLTQYASDSTITGLNQDGYGAGDLVDWQIDGDGIISGVYSNGETLTIGQIALATFASTDNLERAGNNLYMATQDSGQALVGEAGTGGRGSVHQYSLETSNVDIEDEFVTMITAQRGYQASSRVIGAADDLLQELVNIV